MVINQLGSECLHCSESSAESIPNKPNVLSSFDEPRQGLPSEGGKRKGKNEGADEGETRREGFFRVSSPPCTGFPSPCGVTTLPQPSVP